MGKPGILIDIPGFGRREIHALGSDFTGTLTREGKLVAGVKDRLVRLVELVDVHIVTSDVFGTARQQLEGILTSYIMGGRRQDVETERYLRRIEPGQAAALGNGNNDRRMRKKVKQAGGLSVAVENGEGCGVAAPPQANDVIPSPGVPPRSRSFGIRGGIGPGDPLLPPCRRALCRHSGRGEALRNQLW